MKNQTAVLGIVMVAVALGLFPAAAVKADKTADKRAKIDRIAEETMDLLFEENPEARELFDQAHGYAVFDSRKMALQSRSSHNRGREDATRARACQEEAAQAPVVNMEAMRKFVVHVCGKVNVVV